MRVETRGLVLLAAVAALTAMAPPAGAQERASVTVVKGGMLRLEGTSTLHSYSAVAKEYQATVSVKPTATASPETEVWSMVTNHRVDGFGLTIPVKGLSSGENGLDENLRKALRSDKNPNITFRMVSYEVRSPATAGGVAQVAMRGQLNVAGIERSIEINLEAKPMTGGGLRITGSKVLSMTDFKVEPPVLMLGILRTGDQVTIRFDLEVRNG